MPGGTHGMSAVTDAMSGSIYAMPAGNNDMLLYGMPGVTVHGMSGRTYAMPGSSYAMPI